MLGFSATADERLSSDSEGIERYRVFDERIRNLDLKLQAFANAVRQLGSSAGLLNAAYYLRARLTQIQYFFRENVSSLKRCPNCILIQNSCRLLNFSIPSRMVRILAPNRTVRADGVKCGDMLVYHRAITTTSHGWTMLSTYLKS